MNKAGKYLILFWGKVYALLNNVFPLNIKVRMLDWRTASWFLLEGLGYPEHIAHLCPGILGPGAGITGWVTEKGRYRRRRVGGNH